MKFAKYIAVAGLACLAAGCGTVEQPYIPSQMGTLNDGEVIRNLEVTITPDKYQAKIGDPLTFSVTIKNQGTQPVLIHKNPDIIMTWVYPDGKRDNIIRGDDTTPSGNATILLQPGEQRVTRSIIATYYFDRSGITEFRALVGIKGASDKNAKWEEQIASNGYGVMLSER